MLKKSILLISVVLMLALAGNASASKWWWGNVDSNWFEPNNYSDSAVPTSADGVNMSISDVGTHDALVIVTGQDCDCASMWSYNELNSTTKWSITGGSLTLHESYLLLGSGSASGDSVFEVSGGTVNADYDTRVGRYLSGGNNGTGYLNMTGGTFNTDDLVIGSVSGWYDGKGYINLNGGTINANTLAMEATCILDITEGTLIIDGNAVSTVQGYVDNGWITAYSETGTVVIDYDNTNPGKTTVTGLIGNKAWSPDPYNAEQNVDTEVDLYWGHRDCMPLM